MSLADFWKGLMREYVAAQVRVSKAVAPLPSKEPPPEKDDELNGKEYP